MSRPFQVSNFSLGSYSPSVSHILGNYREESLRGRAKMLVRGFKPKIS